MPCSVSTRIPHPPPRGPVSQDRLHTPLRDPLVEGRHLVYYDNQNRSDFWYKLWEAVGARGAARSAQIASEGRDHVLMHHRMVVRVDFVLSVLTNPNVDLRTRCAVGVGERDPGR